MIRIIFIIIYLSSSVNNFPPGSCSLDRKLDQDDLKMIIIIAMKTQLLITSNVICEDMMLLVLIPSINCKVVALLH